MLSFDYPSTSTLLSNFCRPPLGSTDPETLVMIFLVAPLLEEFVIQAGLQEWLLKRRRRRTLSFSSQPTFHWGIIFICAFAFALLHLNRSVGLAVAVFFPGVLFAMIFQKTHKWWLSALVHSAFNFTGWFFCQFYNS